MLQDLGWDGGPGPDYWWRALRTARGGDEGEGFRSVKLNAVSFRLVSQHPGPAAHPPIVASSGEEDSLLAAEGAVARGNETRGRGSGLGEFGRKAGEGLPT